MSSNSKDGPGRKILKVLGIVFGSLLGLILIISILLLTVLEPYAARYLKKQVSENSDGLYQLEFEDLDINLFTTTISFSKLHLAPDSSVHRRQLAEDDASPVLVAVKAQEFKIAGISLLDFLLRDKLRIHSILLDQPEIILLQDERVTEQANQKKEAGKGIQDVISSLAIGDIDIRDASIRYLSRNSEVIPLYNISQLSLQIDALQASNFEQQEPRDIFQADNITLSIRNQSFHTADSVYHIRFNLFSYSSRSAELSIEGLSVQGDPEANMALEPHKSSPLIIHALQAPLLQIRGMDVLEAYRSKELQIQELVLKNAVLDVLENPAIPATSSEFEMAALYEQASDYLHAISIGALRIEEAQLRYHTQLEEITLVHQLDNLTIALEGIQLDSASLFTPKDKLPVQHLLLLAKGYHYEHPLSPYVVDLARLELNTRDKFLQADSIAVEGDWKKNDRLKQLPGDQAHFLVYNLASPRIRLDSLDPLRAYKHSRLALEKIEIQNPSIDLMYDKQVKAPEIDSLAINTYQGVSEFIKELRVGEIHIADAHFSQHIKEQNAVRVQHLEQASLRIGELLIDSVFIYKQEPSLPLDAIALRARQYTFQTHDQTQVLRMSRLGYSSRQQELNAHSINLQSNRQANELQKRFDNASANLFDFSATQFRVRGLDIEKAMNSGRLDLDQIVLQQASLAIMHDRDVPTSGEEQDPEQAGQELFNMLNPITVKSIRMEDGSFTYLEKRDEIQRTQHLKKVSVEITGLHLSPDRLGKLDDRLPIDEMIVQASNYTYQSPDSIYTIFLDSLHYSTRQQQLTARVFELRSDKEAHARKKESNLAEASRNLFDINAETFKVTGLDLVRAYNTGSFTMKEMVLTNPTVAILQDRNVPDAAADTDADKKAAAKADDEQQNGKATVVKEKMRKQEATKEADQKDEEILKQLAEQIETFHIEEIRVVDGSFKFNILEDSLKRSQSLDRLSLKIAKFRLTDLRASDPLDMFAVDDIEMLMQDYSLLTADSLYEFRIAQVRASLTQQTLSIDKLYLQPLFNIDEYEDRLEYADDRFEIIVPSVRMQGIDLRAYFNEEQFIAEKIIIQQPETNIYRDNRLEQDPNRYPPTLQKMLRDAPLYIRVDSVMIEEGTIIYSEISPDGVEPGVVTLADTWITLVNVTNDSLHYREQSIIHALASTRLMDESRLRVEFEFYMDHPEDFYSYKGSLEEMKFRAFNPIFEKLMFVRMESGLINRLDFSVQSTKDVAEGLMKLPYQNLKIQLVNKEDPENPGFLRNAGSWLINNVVVKDNNPSRLINNFRNGEIDVARDHQKSVFNHMSSAMISGIASSLMPGLIEKILEVTVGMP